MVGEQLQRDAGDNRHEHRACFRHYNEVVCNFVERVAVFRSDCDDLAAASLDFADVADDLVEQGVLRRDDHDRHVFVDKGDRTVLHFGGRVAFGVDVADFLELQGAFHGDRVAEVAAEVQEVVCLAECLCDFGDAVRKLERLGDKIREIHDVLDDFGTGFKAESALTSEQKCNHGEHGHLACECLGASHTDFWAGVQVNATVACTCNRRTHAVTDGERGCALLLRFLQSGKRVCRFTGLADGEHERTRLDNRVSVAEFRSVFDFDRNASQVFNHVFTHHAGVVACAASRNDDAVDVAEFLDVRIETGELGVPFGGEQTTAGRIAEHFGLFENFLEHEMRESALRYGVCVKFHVLDFALHFVAAHVHDRVTAILDLHDVVVVQIDDLLRVVDDGRNVTGEIKVTVVPDTENERASATCANQDVRFFVADDPETERTFDLLERLEHGGLQIAVVIAGYEVGDDFRIGFGLEFDTFRNELRLEACVVFDNAVVDNRNFSVKARVRVRVGFGGGAVGGPARVGDTDGTLDGATLQFVFERFDFSGGADNLDFALVDDGNS